MKISTNKPYKITLPHDAWKHLEKRKLTSPLLKPDKHGFIGSGTVHGMGIYKRYIGCNIPSK